MSPLTVLQSWPFAAAAVATFWLFGTAWAERKRPYVAYFLVLVAIACLWTGLALAYHLAETVFARHLLLHLRYIPITMIPVAWLMFSLAYSGDVEYVGTSHILVLLLVPLTSLVLLATNPSHHLFFLGYAVSTHPGGLPNVEHEFGFWFWVNTYYAYTLLGVGVAVMVATLVRSSAALRGRAVLMVLGALVPWLTNAAFLAYPEWFWNTDPTAVAFGVSTLAFGLCVLRYDVLELMPVSRSRVFLESLDAMLVINQAGKLLDLNQAAQNLLGVTCREVVGRPLPSTLHPLLESGRAEGGLMVLDVNGVPQRFSWRASPLARRDAPASAGRGCTILLSNVEAQLALIDELSAETLAREEEAARRGTALHILEHQMAHRLRGISGLADAMSEELEGEHGGYAKAIHETAVLLQEALTAALDAARGGADQSATLDAARGGADRNTDPFADRGGADRSAALDAARGEAERNTDPFADRGGADQTAAGADRVPGVRNASRSSDAAPQRRPLPAPAPR